MGVMIAAPRDVYSGTVANQLNATIPVLILYTTAAVFRVPDRAAWANVAPYSNYTVKQKTFDQGLATFTYAVFGVRAGGTWDVAPFEDVTSPTKGYWWAIRGTPEKPEIDGSLGPPGPSPSAHNHPSNLIGW
eukprot:m51a1_g9224 hypothetical protein (132) ;mRNA; r:66814-67383